MRTLCVLALTAAIGAAGCERTPTAPEAAASTLVRPEAKTASQTNSEAPFRTWRQGFDHGTEGWFGSETENPGHLGWCGTVERAVRGDGGPGPSAGRGYARVAQGGCNAFWTGLFGPVLSGPWAPGPDFSNLSEIWPEGGFVQELDVYLDPAWTAGTIEAPNYILGPPGTVLTYAASLRLLSSPVEAGTFFYFYVPVIPTGSGTLSIFGYEVGAAGWYTFRHVFGDDDGSLSVVFELAARRGGTLLSHAIESEFFSGLSPADLPAPEELGAGYPWFVSIAPGLELPIDEHRLRPGS